MINISKYYEESVRTVVPINSQKHPLSPPLHRWRRRHRLRAPKNPPSRRLPEIHDPGPRHHLTLQPQPSVLLPPGRHQKIKGRGRQIPPTDVGS